MKDSLHHDNCIGCSLNGMLIHDVDAFQKTQELRSSMTMDRKREGWIGIPHGGIGMGAIMELISFHENYPSDPKDLFPLQVHFRMGGTSVRTGDRVVLRTWPVENGAEGEISVNGSPQPYVSSTVFFHKDDQDLRETFFQYMPVSANHMGQVKADMPNYQNCFVCGLGRHEPGLRRRFQAVEKDGRLLAICTVGFSESDREEFFWCRRGNDLHPLALLAILDETMGWGGFLLSGHGGVSVRFSFLFLRNIGINEKFVVFGRGEKVKGNIEKRLMFWSSGGIAVVREDGSFEPIAASSSQTLALAELTEQMKTNLFPEESTLKVFQMAGLSAFQI